MEDRKRDKEFSKNYDLEHLLTEVTELLSPANIELGKRDSSEKYTKIFIVGALRSGTTLFTQWLANTGLVAYPTNLLSRFYGAPLIGAKIQQLLTDPRYNFRNEILDFRSEINFNSENGKTKGALAPNEFWYFWRRFLPFDALDYMASEDLRKKADLAGLKNELNALANILEKPFALKAMILNQNIPDLDDQFENALFIWIRRDPVFNIQSVLQARQRQFGDLDTWYSFKIKEYPELKDLNPLDSAAGQVSAINRSIEEGIAALPEHKKLTVQYEEFCQRPESFYNEIISRLRSQADISASAGRDYSGEKQFSNTNQWVLEEYSKGQAERAFEKAIY